MSRDKPHLRTIANQDGAAVLDTNEGTIFTLNPTGSFIWQALERGECEAEIVDSLAHETAESAAAIRHDVTAFIAALRERKML
jgi:hypothetical protein